MWPGGEVVGADFSEAMLDRARVKSARPPADGSARPRVEPRFESADAMSLPYPDDRFDAATVAFGVRNFEDLGRGLSEMARVVRPGGRVVVLEITTPTRAPLSLFYGVWFDRLVPALGRLAGVLARGSLAPRVERRGGDRRGVQLPSQFGEALSGTGGARSGDGARGDRSASAGVLLAGGIVAIHVGTRRGGQPLVSVVEHPARQEPQAVRRPATHHAAAGVTACASGWPASSATSST